MGSTPSETPEIRLPDPEPDVRVPEVLPRVPESMQVPPMPAPKVEPVTRYIILFALTLLTTTFAGLDHYANFIVGFSSTNLTMPFWSLLIHGLLYSLPVLLILGAHEFGHYFACRYYRVDASLPYFLPLPLPFTGTLGAVIRIRQPIPGKRPLFDIGIAGPIAGFIVAVPVLMLGMYLSTVVRIPTNFEGQVIEIGEPLLFKAAAWLTFGTVPDGYTVNMHPIAFAAWFGLLATALNLFPIGQLDGGHICYAVLGRRSTAITIATVACLVGLSVLWTTSWIVWTVLTVAMLVVFGPRHPRVYDEDVPLDRTRLWLAAFAVIMFTLSFTPAPMRPIDLVRTTGLENAQRVDVDRDAPPRLGHLAQR